MNQTVSELKSLLHDQPKTPLRPDQVRNLQEEDARLTGVIQAPAWLDGPNRGEAAKSRQRVRKMLADGLPKPIPDGPKRDKIAKMVTEAIGFVREAMLPRSVMRRNPAGAVDQFMRRENSKAVKDTIQTVKRGMRALEPDNEEQDYTNMERFRPEGLGPDGTSTFMAEAQIPGKFAMSPKAKDNWPLGEPTSNTALKQVQKRERTPAQKAALARAQEARKAKLAATTSTTPSAHDVPVADEVTE